MANPKVSLAEFKAITSKVTEIDWARFAAYLDSEGSIFIAGDRRSRTHALTVIVANTDMRLINWLLATFSGYVYQSHSKSQRGFSSNNICYSWRVFEEKAEIVLSHCLPYMICKKEQAEVGLSYRAIKRQWSRGRKVTPEQFQARENLRNKVIALNSSSEHKTLVNAR